MSVCNQVSGYYELQAIGKVDRFIFTDLCVSIEAFRGPVVPLVNCRQQISSALGLAHKSDKSLESFSSTMS